MTIPIERTKSLIRCREFLGRLLLRPGMGGFKGVPREVRDEAASILRHFPHPYELADPSSWDPEEIERYYEGRDV